MVTRTERLYREFRGDPPKREGYDLIGVRFGRRWIIGPGRSNIAIPEELAVIGHVNAIEYDGRFDAKVLKARHEFEAGSRPMLAVGTEPGQVFLIGNRFVFTRRGIMDIDAHGKLIEDPRGLPKK